MKKLYKKPILTVMDLTVDQNIAANPFSEAVDEDGGAFDDELWDIE